MSKDDGNKPNIGEIIGKILGSVLLFALGYFGMSLILNFLGI